MFGSRTQGEKKGGANKTPEMTVTKMKIEAGRVVPGKGSSSIIPKGRGNRNLKGFRGDEPTEAGERGAGVEVV